MTFRVNIFRSDISQNITSYDLLKTFALITMFVDHIGYFFYEDIQELRLIGRLSAPVWFFLIGYALHKRSELRLWIWGTILLVGSVYMQNGYGALPLNIIFTFLLIRALLDYVMVRATQDFEKLFGILTICAIIAIPSMFILEYGSLGFLFAMCGYIARHKNNLKNLSPLHIYGFSMLTATVYTLGMWYEFHQFEIMNVAFMFIMLICLSISLMQFQPMEFKSDGTLKTVIKYPLFIMGRRTLEIYVLHLLLFLLIINYVSNS